MNKYENEDQSTGLLAFDYNLLSGFGTQFQVLFFPSRLSKTSYGIAQNDLEIVLVEDNYLDAQLVAEVTRSSKFKCKVTIKPNCLEALDYLCQVQDKFLAEKTLVLLDLTMAGIGGLKLLAKMRQDEQLKTVPVSILTVSARSEDIATAAQLGIVSYMIKPGTLKQFKVFSKCFDELLVALFDSRMPEIGIKPSVSPTFVG